MSTYKMTDEHKTAMAEGRTDALAVRYYLEALAKTNQNDSVKIARKLARVEAQLEKPDLTPVQKLRLLQDKKDLKRDLARSQKGISEETERKFIECAARYSEKYGIERSTWREMGVPKRVLDLAGVK